MEASDGPSSEEQPEVKRREAYDTDLSDEQWELIAPLLERTETRGKKREVDMREVVNGMLYQTRTGCQWRMIPHDFGVHWSVIRYYFDTWRHDGTFQHINDFLRRCVRRTIGRQEEPSAGSIDSQSAKAAQKGALRSTRRAMTRARRSRAASATSSSTRSASCSA